MPGNNEAVSEPPRNLIPARKAKLPKGYSYPIGTEILSTTLAPVPQYDDLSVGFSWQDQWPGAAYQKKIESNGKIKVLEISFRLANRPYDRAFPNKWRFFIHAVPSEHNQIVKSLLTEGILDRLKDALMETDKYPSSFSWKAIYNLAEETMEIGR